MDAPPSSLSNLLSCVPFRKPKCGLLILLWMGGLAVDLVAQGAIDVAPTAAAPAPGIKPALEIRSLSLELTPHFPSAVVSWVETVAAPRGVLVVADQLNEPQKVFSQDLVDYAKKIGFGLSSLDFKETKQSQQPSTSIEAIASLESALYGAMDKIYSPGKRLVAIGSGRGAFWTQQLVMRQPARWGFWLVRSSKDFPEPLSNVRMPYGVIFASSPEEQTAARKYFEVLRRGVPENRIILVNCAKKRLDTGMATRFWRSTFESFLDAPTETGLWHDLVTQEMVSPAIALAPHQLRQLPPVESLCWLPNREIAAMWRVLCTSPANGQPSLAVSLQANANPAVTAGGLKIWRRTYEPLGGLDRMEFQWVVQHEKCKGVLLYVDNADGLDWVLSDPEWTRFGRENQVNLVVLKLKTVGSNLKGERPKIFADQIFNFVDEEFGKRAPILIHTEGEDAGYWMQHVIHLRGERIKAWGSVSCLNFPAVGAKLSVPPGFLLPVTVKGRSSNFLYFEELRASDPANAVAMVVGDPNTTDKGQTCEFSRTYFTGVLKGNDRDYSWRNFNDWAPLQKIATKAEKRSSKDYGWFPNPESVGMWKLIQPVAGKAALIEPTSLPLIAKRTFDTGLQELPQLNFFIRIPGKLLEGGAAKGVYCFSTWEKEDTTLTNKLKNQDDSAVKFAERNDLAMVTWNTAKLFPGGSLQAMTAEQMTIFEARMRKVTEAWDKGMKKVAAEFNLPENGYLLHGTSQGSNLGHQMPLFLPGKFLAAHMHICNRYITPKPEAHETLWLLTTGELDGGYKETWQFYQTGIQMNYPMMIKAGANLGHAGRSDINALGFAFFEYALRLHEQALAERNQVQFTLKKSEVPSAAERMRRGMASASHFGDFVNHEVFPSKDAATSWVPAAQRVPIPTDILAQAWNTQPQGPMASLIPPVPLQVTPLQPRGK